MFATLLKLLGVVSGGNTGAVINRAADVGLIAATTPFVLYVYNHPDKITTFLNTTMFEVSWGGFGGIALVGWFALKLAAKSNPPNLPTVRSE